MLPFLCFLDVTFVFSVFTLSVFVGFVGAVVSAANAPTAIRAVTNAVVTVFIRASLSVAFAIITAFIMGYKP